MPLRSLARIRGEFLSPYHTRDEPEHPAVEAIPVFSDGKSENLVLPDCSESWRRLDSAEGRVLSVLFPVPKVIPCRRQLLTFEQGDNESLGAAWARFTHLATSGPPHKISEEMLMQHFIYGLNPESERFLNLASV